MTPVRIRVENFFSYEKAELELEGRGLVLVTGRVHGECGVSSNGAGKTSLVVDAMLFALFGRTLRGARGESVVRHTAGRDCVVVFTCRGSDGRLLEIGRPQKHRKYAKPWVRLIDINATRYGVEEVDRAVHGLLGGMSFTTFASSVLFGHGNARFFTQLSDAERKAVLDEILELQDLDKMNAIATREAEKVRSSVLDMQTHVAVLTDRTTYAEKCYQELLELQRTTHETLDVGVEETARQLQQLTDEATAHTAECETTQAAIKELAARHAADERVVTRVAERTAEMSSACDALASPLAECTAQIAVHNHAVQQYMELEGQCPQCRQSIDPAHLHRLVEEEQARLVAVQYRHAVLQEELRSRRTELQEYQAMLVEKNARWGDQFAALLTLRGRAQELDQLQRTCVLRREMLEEQHRQNTERLAELDMRVEKAKLALALAQSQMQDATDRLHALKAEEQQWTFWKQATGNAGLKNALLREAIPFLNSRAHYYATLLCDDAVTVSFDTEQTLKSGETRDRFDVVVRARDGGNTYTEVSDGQRRRADIIATLALGDLARGRTRQSLNLLILDEIADGLDAAGIERLVQLLTVLSRSVGSVFVISHLSDLHQHFPTTVSIERTEGVSHVLPC